MSKLQEFRSKYPQYDDMPDEELAKALHQKYYSDMPYEEYAKQLGVVSAPKVKVPMEKGASFSRGLRDPIDAGAQWLTEALPQGVVQKGNEFNNFLARTTGIVAPIPEGGVSQMVNQGEQEYQAKRAAAGEEGYDWDRLGGNIINPVNLAVGGATANLARFAGAGALGQSAAAGTALGGLTPVYDQEGQSFAEQKAKQVASGTVLGPVGTLVMKGMGASLNPAVKATQEKLKQMGIRLTPGQILGGKFNTAEEFLQSMPFAGAGIRDARQRAVYDFNKAVLGRTLSHIDEKLDTDVIGREAIKQVSKKVDTAYNNALSGMKVTQDKVLGNQLLTIQSQAAKSLNNEQTAQLQKLIKSEVVDKVAKGVEGQQIKVGLESKLNELIKSYKSAADPNQRQVGDYLLDVKDAVRQAIERQNPKDAVTALRKADAARADLYRVEQAATYAESGNGIFSPEAFSRAVRAKDPTRNKRDFAKGEARLQEESDAALDVLGNAPGSTLEGRLGLSVGGGYAAVNDPLSTAALLTGLGLLYRPGGVKAADIALSSRPGLARDLGKFLQNKSVDYGPLFANPGVFQYNVEDRKKKKGQ